MGHKDVDELIVLTREWRQDARSAAYMFFDDDRKEWWEGGYCPQDPLLDYKLEWNRRDSVSYTHPWLWDVVNGAGPRVEADRREMIRCGYEKIAINEFGRNESEDDEANPPALTSGETSEEDENDETDDDE
ncbi:hypothetical protein LQW54_009120 [Pestalotiopsis sp. IQ-011]